MGRPGGLYQFWFTYYENRCFSFILSLFLLLIFLHGKWQPRGWVVDLHKDNWSSLTQGIWYRKDFEGLSGVKLTHGVMTCYVLCMDSGFEWLWCIGFPKLELTLKTMRTGELANWRTRDLNWRTGELANWRTGELASESNLVKVRNVVRTLQHFLFSLH